MRSEPKIAGLILAAGSGRRFGAGSAKAVAAFEGLPMVRRVAEAALKAGLHPLIVVTGQAHVQIQEALVGLERQIRCVRNESPELGQGGSLALGAQTVFESQAETAIDGLAVLLADQPLIDAALIRDVIDAWADRPKPRGIARPIAEGQAGHPVIFDTRFLEELRALQATQSGRDIIRRHRDALVELPIEQALRLDDVDTRAALAALEAKARSSKLGSQPE